MEYRGKKVLMVGKATPSARPKRARTASSMPVECWAAHGVRKVARDQTVAPHAMTRFPPYRSASAPPATDDITYPHKNDDCRTQIKPREDQTPTPSRMLLIEPKSFVLNLTGASAFCAINPHTRAQKLGILLCREY